MAAIVYKTRSWIRVALSDTAVRFLARLHFAASHLNILLEILRFRPCFDTHALFYAHLLISPLFRTFPCLPPTWAAFP
jgi:hypothetical protein